MVPIYLQGKMEHWKALKTYLTLQAKGMVTKAAWMFLFKMILQQARIALSKKCFQRKYVLIYAESNTSLFKIICWGFEIFFNW